jgi:hypothetical protein
VPVNDFQAKMVDSKLSVLEIQCFFVSRKGAKHAKEIETRYDEMLAAFFDTKTRRRKDAKTQSFY